jgi:hypothetical protein
LYIIASHTTNIGLNRTINDVDSASYGRMVSYISAAEIAGA